MLLLSLLACAHRPRPVDDTGPDTADTGARMDPCGAWAGVGGVGTRWVYAPTDDYVARTSFDGTFTTQVTAIEGAEVTLTQTGAYVGASGEFSWTRTELWRCDADGAWLLRSDAETNGTSGTGEIHSIGWRTFEPGWLVRPAVRGDWSDAFTLTAAINGAEPSATAVTCETTVTTAATWSGAGGPAEALLATPVCTGVGAAAYTLAAGIGLSGTPDEELVEYAR